MRMVALPLTFLSPMQKGVQTAHAVAEYVFQNHSDIGTEKWVSQDRTLIILDGGTVRDIAQNMMHLDRLAVKYAFFKESDSFMGGLITCICFLHEPGNDPVLDSFISSKRLAQ